MYENARNVRELELIAKSMYTIDYVRVRHIDGGDWL
jgi:hypothetical protein